MNKETLEEAAENYARKQCDDMYDDIAPSGGSWGWETSTDFIEGAKWQAERMYSEEDMKKCWDASSAYTIGSHKDFKQSHPDFKEWFEQFSKLKND